MSEHVNHSEITRLRQRITDEYLAAQRGLTGLASGVAMHQFITARLEKMGASHQELKHLVGEQEAARILAETLEGLSGVNSTNRTGVNMHPAIRPEQLTEGTVIVYHLLPRDHPTHPERAWRGRIIQTMLGQVYKLDVVLVESLEEGYEGETEHVLLRQIVGIEREGER